MPSRSMPSSLREIQNIHSDCKIEALLGHNVKNDIKCQPPPSVESHDDKETISVFLPSLPCAIVCILTSVHIYFDSSRMLIKFVGI